MKPSDKRLLEWLVGNDRLDRSRRFLGFVGSIPTRRAFPLYVILTISGYLLLDALVRLRYHVLDLSEVACGVVGLVFALNLWVFDAQRPKES